MYYFCLDRLSCCRVSCDKARWQNRGGRGGARGAVAPPPPPKLLASGNRGDGQDWLGNRVTSTIPIIFRCHSDSLSGEILVVATYIPTLQAVPTCIQKSCTIPTSLNAGCLRSGTGSDS